MANDDAQQPILDVPAPPWWNGQIDATQHDYLMTNLRGSRISTRRQGGRDLSYLESWEVRAHLIRIFGFGNFDIETLSVEPVFVRDYMGGPDQDKPMKEVAYRAIVQLTLRNPTGQMLARYSESAVGSESGGTGFGDLHDNAVKTAISDALKRCCINLGTQFGLSLYNNGAREDVVRFSLVRPEGATRGVPPTQQAPGADLSPQAAAALSGSLGAVPIGAAGQETLIETGSTDTPPDRADTPRLAEQDDSKRTPAEAPS